MLIPFNKLMKKYNMNINGILHIGAHKCEELEQYHKYGLNNNQILWVEANPKLVNEIIEKDNTINIKNFICCDTDIGKTKLNLANNGQSSSILELGTHENSYPNIKYIGSIEVKNHRIDTIYKMNKIPNNFANFLNIDIQGSELSALKGLGKLIHEFEYIYLEVNKDYVYKNCALVEEIDQYLLQFNFVRKETIWTTEKWGRCYLYKKKQLLLPTQELVNKNITIFTKNKDNFSKNGAFSQVIFVYYCMSQIKGVNCKVFTENGNKIYKDVITYNDKQEFFNQMSLSV